MTPAPRGGALRALLPPVALLALVALVYWPVHAAGFFWDDRIYVHDVAWLRSGAGWWNHVFGGIFDSGDFFRPLVIALLAGESLLFDTAAASLHLVSLAIHLANTLLVGILAMQLSPARHRAFGTTTLVAMLLFGLHPLLIEPVAWIVGQFDLVVTLFMLLGLVANLTVRGTILRSLTVGACFFLAACAKEAAVAFPLLLAVCDWLRPNAPAHASARSAIAARLRSQWPVYLTVVAAGLAYLAIRHAALGYLVLAGHQPSIGPGQRFQLICASYFAYWRLIVFPMNATGLLHNVPYERFGEITPASLAADAFTLALLACGAVQFARRRAIGGLIAGVTVALLPVLHLLPIEFDPSYYHDRYATMALALACAFLPRTLGELAVPGIGRRFAIGTGAVVGLAWLAAAAVSIRVTLPLWTDEILLWQWALRQNPDSILVKESLLSDYLARNELARARPLADMLERDATQCSTCMLNVAIYAIMTGDAARATAAMQRTAQANRHDPLTRVQMVAFMLANGDLRSLRGDLAGAADAYRNAVKFAPLVPGPYMSLANVLARLGRFDEAKHSADQALALYAPDVREQHRRNFDRILAEARAALSAPGQ